MIEMKGYTTNYVNLIAENLRDRYENGLPILKELMQNADDAKACTFIFGRGAGFPDASHPLLKGPGLWFFNDGEFKESDADALRSFGINSKAGDASAIGKFGLGMKSVFHLCEALFYVASDRKRLHKEGLSPWKQDGHTLHPEWDEISDADWSRLSVFGQKLATDAERPWFLLWLPLRRKEHLRARSGRESGAIIARFPGDDPFGELAFLNDRELAHDIAKMLPLLQHLERVEQRGSENPFILQLDGTRLMGDRIEADGQVLLDGRRSLLAFSGKRVTSRDPDARFANLKQRKEWPPIRYRDEEGHERQAKDKTSPEAAVLFCASRGDAASSRLSWAVFLPVEDGSESLKVDRETVGHSLILHGQFFLDAGRKRIRRQECLHREPPAVGGRQIDPILLQEVWNQRLAQEVVFPLVLPALEGYAEQQRLSDDECSALTKALSDSDWFGTFKGHVCRDACWMRILRPGAEPRWRLVKGELRSCLRPVPPSPRSAPERPWKVFPELTSCDVTLYDNKAPCLANAPGTWEQAEIEVLLSRVDGLFTDAQAMDYWVEFLGSCAEPHLYTENPQRRLLGVLRSGLRTVGLEARRQVVTKARRLIGFVEPKRRLTLSSELPDPVLKKLWAVDAPVLLVPKGFDPDQPGGARPDEPTLAALLEVLDSALDSKGTEGVQQPILDAVQDLLRTLQPEERGRFLRKHKTLRVIGVWDARRRVERPVSLEYLEDLQRAATLFRFAGGLRDAMMGIAPQLAPAIPDAPVCLVRTGTYRNLFPDDGTIPEATDGVACLAAVGRHTGRLGDLVARRELLERANNPGTDQDARRGLRLLLHGSLAHRMDNAARLWVDGHNQHSAWSKLWANTHRGLEWSRVPEELVNTIPGARWSSANITEIDARTLIDELHGTGQGIKAPEEFTVEERDEILSRIEDKDLWQRLPLHTTLGGDPVSAVGQRVYLAPRAREARGFEEPMAREATLIAPRGNTVIAAQQKRWLRPLDDRARIEIALGSAAPSRHWRGVMDALGAIDKGTIDDDLRTMLRNTAWLPTIHDTPTKPEDVIDLHGSLGDEAHRLVSNHRATHDPCFAVPAEIDAAVRDHQAWPQLREVGFSSLTDGIALGLLLQDLPNYHIGTWPTQPLPKTVTLLARCDRLPGWRLLKTAAAEPLDLETAWAKIGPALSKPIDAKRIEAVLDWLSGDNDQWERRKSIYDTYLRELVELGRAARSHVPYLRLASAAGQWRKAAELCAGAHSAAQAVTLDDGQKDILKDLIWQADSSSKGGQANQPGVLPAPEPPTFREYFQAWNSNLVPAPMVGVVLALVGPAVRDLAREHLYPHSFEWLVEKLPWRDPEATPQQQALALSKAKTAVQALELVKAGVQLQTGNDMEVPNLLGQPMRVALDDEARTLLAGALNYHWREGYRVVVPLRRIDPDRLQTEQLRALLRATAEQLYCELYNQGSVDFSSLWRELDRSDQLEILVARRLILDHVPFYLRQLSIKSKGIEAQLAVCDSRRRGIAEAEAEGQSTESARKDLRQALEELADQIDRRPDEQQAVLQAVRNKLEQYQYEPSSIPFELFQNADDAAVELGHLHAYPSAGCEIPQEARRFVVEDRDDGLAFLYWGRPVNARGPVGFDGERRGYDRDLEKMLILSATDKRDDEGVTGKFGLGFKSVLLACEQPRILSGRLAVRVVSGILPQTWEKNVREARQRLVEHGTDARLPGTLIDLPGVKGELRDRVLGRFEELAGILCVFGRTVRSITRVTASDSTRCWQPREVCPGVEVGELDLPGDWGACTTALCVRTDRGCLLMALGPQGFRALPDAIPALWVTAPTSESLAFGFAINGSFDPDAGRGRLAYSAANLEKAKQIGRETGNALGALLERSREDWCSVRAALGLAADLDALDFWESIWFGLTKGWLGRGGGNGTDLVREVVLGTLIRLCERPRVVPNGLKGSLREFTGAKQIRYELSGVLLHEDVCGMLCAWDRFTNHYGGHMCVSKEIGDILRQADLCHPRTIGLSALVGVLEQSNAEPTDAAALGRLRLLTAEASDWKSEDLAKRMRTLRFRTEAGGWALARNLLALHGAGLDPDEPRRHALAPSKCRLHPDYYVEAAGEWPAVALFQFCRQRMEAPVETLTQWVLNAKSVEARSAALRYLAVGDLGDRVAEQVREEPGWLGSALENPEFNLKNNLEPKQFGILSRRLVSQSQVELIVSSHGQEQRPRPTDGYRTSSEATIARILNMLEIEFDYERALLWTDKDGRRVEYLPDFSFTTPCGDRIIWEHLGMYNDPSYRKGWHDKLQKYEQLGYREDETLFTTISLHPEELLSTALDIKRRLISVPATVRASPQHVLSGIYEWWHEQGRSERDAYSRDVYPVDVSPSGLCDFVSGNLIEMDSRNRTLWFTMFALACFQSLGRTQGEQHRGFIERGMRDGWWLELAESKPPDDFQPWLARLEHWAAPNRIDQDFLPWKRTFVDLYTVARWLDEYIQSACKFPRIVENQGQVSLDAVVRPTYAPEAAQLGVDAAPINRSLGIGANWLIRELVRHKVYGPDDESLLAPYCWMSNQRVRDLLNRLGAPMAEQADSAASRPIYDFVVEHIGADHARFDGDFDLPLQIITRSKHRKTLQRLFEEAGLDAQDFRDGSGDGADNSWTGQGQ